MKVSIGILAWNEEEAISKTLQSLFNQSLFQSLSETLQVEVVCVPNGCSDDTAGAASRAFKQFRPANDYLDLRIENSKSPGKANAWNLFVHDLSDAAADIVFLMDSDIDIRHPNTLVNMMTVLEDQSHVLAVTDEPIKHVLLKKNKSFFDCLSVAINRGNQAAPGQLTGQLYCVRGDIIRQILMPRGLLLEDGFVKYMVATKLYTEEADNGRLQQAQSASHVFEGYTSLKDIFGHQRRQAVGDVILRHLLTNIKENCGDNLDAGQYLRDREKDNPNWLLELMKKRNGQGQWLIPKGALLVRFARLRHISGWRKIPYLAAVIAVFPFDVCVYLSANNVLKTGTYADVWQDTRITDNLE